jgi:hypothetical protein
MKLPGGIQRELKVHRKLFIFSELVSRYLKEHDFVAQLERGDVEIAKPLGR